MTELEKSIRELREQGLTYSQIKAKLGCSKSTISYYLGEDQPDKTKVRTKTLETAIREMVREYKENNPCADCGNKYSYWIMQFDHLPGVTKLFNIANFKSYTKDIDVVISEMAKCELVCANCHANRSFFRRVAISEGLDVTELYIDELD
jgi:hypothetical protein